MVGGQTRYDLVGRTLSWVHTPSTVVECVVAVKKQTEEVYSRNDTQLSVANY